MTIFDTPILSPVLRVFCRVIMWGMRWNCRRQVPADMKKCVVIVAPHTSNWDFVLFIIFVFARKMRFDVLIKHNVFNGPFGWFFRYCGGIPIDRDRAAARVKYLTELFETREQLHLLITPEGTRAARTHWKTGFHHIAAAANVPICVAYLDAKTKEVGVAYILAPNGDLKQEMADIYALYDKCTSLRPENYASPNRPSSDTKSADSKV